MTGKTNKIGQRTHKSRKENEKVKMSKKMKVQKG